MPTNSKKKSEPSRSKKKQQKKQRFASIKQRWTAFMSRRPHRSFRRTRRRDYVRPLALPGYFSFTAEVTKLLWKHKNTFILLALVYMVLYFVLIGIQSQSDYASVGELLQETGGDLFDGNWGAIGQASLLLLSVFSSNVSSSATEAQQIFSVVIFLMAWLTTVWLLRNLLAGHKVKLRDGLYSSGAPLFATIIIALFVAVQLIPAAIAAIGYSAALGTGLLDSGVAAMLFWIAAGLLAILSLYWITSSLFAMVIITLPGMYPWQAIRTAGDIMVGRRVKILLRWLWMAAAVAVVGFVTIVPVILLDMGIKHLWPAVSWLPIVPVTLLVWSGFTVVWIAAYIYLLYRKVVDNA